MENRALGKGLSALIPEKSKLTTLEGDSSGQQASVELVSTSLISDNRLQPRINYNEDRLEELKNSIREQGVLQPILVRVKGDGYEVIAGERRLRAARALKLEKIPVVVKNVTDKEALEIALVENIQREELNPIEEAKAFRKLINDFQYTQDEVAQAVGKDRSTITNLLRVLSLPENIQQGVFDGVISVGHARTLLGLESDNEKNRIFEKIVKESLSVRALENLVKTQTPSFSGARKIKQGEERNYQIIKLEEDLQKVIGTKVRIDASKKRGKIIIEYYSIEDLERITQLIKQ
ncbi:MAG: ParB/RepB/Spo0J family partition protein [Candidatus Omnitrophica bacterium]|nr:ParB/RepB/Spo0J family partition protein [Candidatus Omnitrophota bacterium]